MLFGLEFFLIFLLLNKGVLRADLKAQRKKYFQILIDLVTGAICLSLENLSNNFALKLENDDKNSLNFTLFVGLRLKLPSLFNMI